MADLKLTKHTCPWRPWCGRRNRSGPAGCPRFCQLCSVTPRVVTPSRRLGSASSSSASGLMLSQTVCQSSPSCRAIAETAMSCFFSCSCAQWPARTVSFSRGPMRWCSSVNVTWRIAFRGSGTPAVPLQDHGRAVGGNVVDWHRAPGVGPGLGTAPAAPCNAVRVFQRPRRAGPGPDGPPRSRAVPRGPGRRRTGCTTARCCRSRPPGWRSYSCAAVPRVSAVLQAARRQS